MSGEGVAFLASGDLNRLARWMRLLGYDTLTRPAEEPKGEFVLQALREGRILLTRNRRFGYHPGVQVVVVRSGLVREQLAEVLVACRLKPDPDLRFTRCARCNTELAEVPRAEVRGKVAAYVEKTAGEFYRCPTCGQFFWPGTHVELVEGFLREALGG